MEKNAGLKMEVTCEVSKEHPLTADHTQIGGVVLLSNNNNIIFQNTLESRLDLVLTESVPDIRRELFPNITNL